MQRLIHASSGSKLLFASLIPTVIATAALTGGCAVDAASESSVEAADQDLINAPRDTLNTWAVGVCASTPNADPAKGPVGACLTSGTRCTGSLVGENLVLTARHCVEKFDVDLPTASCAQRFAGPKNSQGLRITLSSSLLDPNPGWIEVREVVTSPETGACDNDVALLILDKKVSANEAKPIAVELRSLVTSPSLRPGQVAMVGRGALAFVLDPATLAPTDVELGNLERRYLDKIPFRCISDVAGRCTTFDLTSDSANRQSVASVGQFITGRGAASGDSGAAIITQRSFAKKKPVAIGVHSITTFGANGTGNAAINARLDRHASWMIAGARRAAALGGYAPPCWANAASGASSCESPRPANPPVCPMFDPTKDAPANVPEECLRPPPAND